jgi:hypothetical protein
VYVCSMNVSDLSRATAGRACALSNPKFGNFLHMAAVHATAQVQLEARFLLLLRTSLLLVCFEVSIFFCNTWIIEVRHRERFKLKLKAPRLKTFKAMTINFRADRPISHLT